MLRSRNGCWKVAFSKCLPVKTATMSAWDAGSEGCAALIRWQRTITSDSRACATM